MMKIPGIWRCQKHGTQNICQEHEQSQSSEDMSTAISKAIHCVGLAKNTGAHYILKMPDTEPQCLMILLLEFSLTQFISPFYVPTSLISNEDIQSILLYYIDIWNLPFNFYSLQIKIFLECQKMFWTLTFDLELLKLWIMLETDWLCFT